MRAILLLFCGTLSAADWYGFAGYGQSLSLGNEGCPAISTSQPYANLMLNANFTATAALIENQLCNLTSSGSQESPNSAAGNNATFLDPAHALISVWVNAGIAGTPISGFQRPGGGCSGGVFSGYCGVVNAATAMKTLATSAGKTFVFAAVHFTEGESDMIADSHTYEADNMTLWTNLNADIKTATGQTEDIVIVFSQVSSQQIGNYQMYTCPDTTVACSGDPAGGATDTVVLAQYALQKRHPGAFQIAGPKYQYTYSAGGLHMDAASYNKLGATVAAWIKRRYLDGDATAAAGIRVASITRSGTTVSASFVTPGGLSLALDTTTVPNPYRNGAADTTGKGFQYLCDNAGTVTEIGISSVSVSGAVATITLASTPSCSTQERLAYAWEGERYANTPIAGCSPDANPSTCTPAGSGNFPTRGTPHGNVRTATDYTSLHSDAIQHWVPTFNEPVGPASNASAKGASGMIR